jgi:hypothetical protein
MTGFRNIHAIQNRRNIRKPSFSQFDHVTYPYLYKLFIN